MKIGVSVFGVSVWILGDLCEMEGSCGSRYFQASMMGIYDIELRLATIGW